jgi:hypothetical protein
VLSFSAVSGVHPKAPLAAEKDRTMAPRTLALALTLTLSLTLTLNAGADPVADADAERWR